MTKQHSVRAGKLLARTTLSLALSLSFGQFASAANEQLEMVPADTSFYFGTGKPVPVEDLFSMVPDLFDAETMAKWVPEVGDSEEEQALMKKIGEFFQDPAKVTREWGLGDELQFTAYAVGLLPVLRIEGDSDQFETAIGKLESENDIQFDKLSHKDIDVRVLAGKPKKSAAKQVQAPSDAEINTAMAAVEAAKAELDAANQTLEAASANLDTAKDANDASGIAAAANEISDAAKLITESQQAQQEAEKKLVGLNAAKAAADKKPGGKDAPGLIIAADGKDLVFALSYNAYDPELLDQVLGIAPPAKSIEASGKVKQIRKEWGYGDEMTMFVDFTLVAESLTGGDTAAAEQLQTLMATDQSMQKTLSAFATEPCKGELSQMAANWPMMVSGNRKFEVNDDRVVIDGHFAMLVEHVALRDTLKLLRGVVPVSQSGSDAMMSFGVGLDLDNLPQLSTQITDLLSGVNFNCEVLSNLNKMSETDLSPLAMGSMMVSGMARGVKGISVNVYDADIDGASKSNPVKSVDAAIALAADDPAMLVTMLRSLPQMSMLAGLPLDGTAMSLNDVLPLPLPAGVEIFAAVKGKNIVIYSGEQAADFSNRLSGDGKEGFMVTTMNTEKMLEKIDSMKDMLPEELKDDEEMVLEMLEKYPRGDVSYQIDFTDRGIEMESQSDIKRPE